MVVGTTEILFDGCFTVIVGVAKSGGSVVRAGSRQIDGEIRQKWEDQICWTHRIYAELNFHSILFRPELDSILFRPELDFSSFGPELDFCSFGPELDFLAPSQNNPKGRPVQTFRHLIFHGIFNGLLVATRGGHGFDAGSYESFYVELHNSKTRRTAPHSLSHPDPAVGI